MAVLYHVAFTAASSKTRLRSGFRYLNFPEGEKLLPIFASRIGFSVKDVAPSLVKKKHGYQSMNSLIA